MAVGNRTSYVATLTPAQITALRPLLEVKGWAFDTAPYAHWRARLDKTSVVAYESGKLTVQGKGTAEVVQYIIEPDILGEARFGYEHELAAVENPEMFAPHAGIDESGKGDYFGPLVIAAACVDEASARKLIESGVADSKTIKSDRRMADLARMIKTTTNGAFSVVTIGPEAYNRLYATIGNVNRLLAWGHARALENLLEKAPDCPRAISDQFGNPAIVKRALQERGRAIELIQRTKAEADIAVAAASVLARAEFVQRLEQLGRSRGVDLPKGAGPKVNEVARTLFERGGRDALAGVAKLHFRTTAQVIGTE